MTYPCIDSTHFDVNVDGELTPKSYLQWRHVATNSAAAIQNNYDVNGGNQAADLLQLQVAWTNTDPFTMKVYGMLTRGGTLVQNQPRNRVFIETYYGAASGVAPADPTPSTLVGRMGNGGDFGIVPSPDRSPFANHQTRQAERTSVLGNTVTLTTGQSYKLRIKLRFDGTFWETLPIYPSGSESEAELAINSGATRLDLFAYPSL